jgi:hypothetical protein
MFGADIDQIPLDVLSRDGTEIVATDLEREVDLIDGSDEVAEIT